MKIGIVAVKGGSGSGNWGHAGRPGLVGGSGGGAGVGAVATGGVHGDVTYMGGGVWKTGGGSDYTINPKGWTPESFARRAESVLGEDWQSSLGETGYTLTDAGYVLDVKPVTVEKLPSAPDVIAEEGIEKLPSAPSVVVGGADIVGQPGQASGGNKGEAGRFLSETVTETTGAPEVMGLRAKWALASSYDRRNAKYTIVEDLSERSGVDKDIVGSIIAQWAGTSNDTDMRSLSLQEAATEELGLKLSAWQQEVIAYTREEGATRPITSRANERAVMRAMYDNTQEQLASSGLKPGDYVQLARGVGHYTEAPTWKEGDVVNYKGNAMESWSVATAVATGFATMETSADYGTVLTMAVPVSSIIGTARTGFGCLTQGEFVIAGNIPGSKATVQMTTY